MELNELWDDPEEISGPSGRLYYRRAVLTWSVPRLWRADEPEFDVPPSWRGRGGVYVFIRSHWRQAEDMRFAYVGKAIDFGRRLTSAHDHFDIVERRGDTAVSCGRVAFEGVRSHPGHLLEIEDVLKFCLHERLENKQGFESLPGFRKSQPRAMTPWVIRNRGFRFQGRMPRRIVYPSIAVEY